MKTLSNFVLAFALLIFGALWTMKPVNAQASGNGVFVLLQAGTPASCAWPAGATVTNGMAICATTSGPYYSLNGSATFLPFSSTVTITGTAPIVVNGTTVSCPSCALTTAVVTSFNGHTGAVNLSKADVTATGLTATTTLQ